MTPQKIKDYFWALGIFLTFITSAWNLWISYRSARHARYGNLVTAERLKWIEKMRTVTSQFCGSVQTWAKIPQGIPPHDPTETALRKEINQLGYQIRLLLDLNYQPDKEIDALAFQIMDDVRNGQTANLHASLEQMTDITRIHMNNEWQKAKAEADKGTLRE